MFRFRGIGGLVELELEPVAWGDRACVLNQFGDLLGSRRTRTWLLNKAVYEKVAVHKIKAKYRVYGGGGVVESESEEE